MTPVRVEDIAAALGRPAHEVAELLQLAELPTSLDAPRDGRRWRAGRESLLDSVADDLAVRSDGPARSHAEVEQLLAAGLAELQPARARGAGRALRPA